MTTAPPDRWAAPPQVAAAADWLAAELPDAVALYVFGSAASGEQRADSDVDLGLLPHAPLPATARWELAQRLAAAIGRDVDLVDLLTTTDVLRVQVIARGRLLWERDPTARAFFEARALGGYVRFQDARRRFAADLQTQLAASRPGGTHRG